MTREEILKTLRIELAKAQRDFYPDRRIALAYAIDLIGKEADDVHRSK